MKDSSLSQHILYRIGQQTDDVEINREIENYKKKLIEVEENKVRLENEIDNLHLDAKFRDRKIEDMKLRLNFLYENIYEIEDKINDACLRKEAVENEKIMMENISYILKNFCALYDKMSDIERRDLISYLIKEVQIYPQGELEIPLKSIEF